MGPEAVVDDDAFTAFFRAHFALTYRVAYRLLGEASAAEDVAAEAFERAYASWSTIGTLPYREAWVLRVATNLALSSLRRKKVVPGMAGVTSDEDATATRLALFAALQHLPQRQREVIVLHHLAGYPAHEVAEVLAISHNTVKKHLQRGMVALRSDIGAVADMGTDGG